jgi:hypothetical protein
VRDLVSALAVKPITAREAGLPAAKGGVPESPGIYAWWLASSASIPGVFPPPHPTDGDLGLLYVGTAPKGSSSASHLRERILKNHLGSRLDQSTLLRALAALLWEQEGWRPRMNGEKWTFDERGQLGLRAWQREHLRVSWVAVEEPWNAEKFVIGQLIPPLNDIGNPRSAFRPALRDARAAYVARAGRAATD